MMKSDIRWLDCKYSLLANCDGEGTVEEVKYCIEVVMDSVVEIFEWITNWLVVRTVMEVDEDEIAEGMMLEDDSIGMMVVDTGTVIDTKIGKRKLERNE